MTGFRITGMASGLPPNIVDQLMEAERIPVKNLEAQKTKSEDRLKLVTDLETKVSDITKNLAELTGTSGFLDKKLTSGDPNVVDGVVDPQTAIPGEYSVEIVQLAQKPGAITNGFPDKDKTQIGVGYIKFKTSEGEKEVYINGKNSTLEGVAKQITDSGTGLRAQVIQDRKDTDNPYKLIVSGLGTGSDKQISFPTVYMLDGDQDIYFDQTRPSVNAKIKVDGFEIELPDNKSKDIIPGVNLDFKSAAPGREIRLNVKENHEVIAGKIKSFVDSFNAALGFIQGQHKLSSADGKNPRMGPLGGDGMLRTIESSLRGLVQDPTYGTNSKIKQLTEIGIEFNRNGTLNFSQDKFNKVLADDPQGVSTFLRGDGFETGFVTKVKRVVGNLLNGQFGAISNRKRGLDSQIKQVNERIDTKERQLTRKEDSLRAKFADLETKMSALNQQGGAFAAMQQKSG